MAQSLAVRRTKDSVTLARVNEIVEQLSARDRSGEIITAVHHIPARDAKFAPMPEWVRPELAETYARKRHRRSCTPTRRRAAASGQRAATWWS